MSEEELRSLAERQHGVVATWQIEGEARGRRREDSGHWQFVTGSVLRRRGSARSRAQEVMVGVLDAGPGAVASHSTAASLWRLPGFASHVIEVTRGGRRTSRQPPVAQLHRPRLLLPHHLAIVEGVPVTSLARTLFDLAGAGVRPERIGRLVNLVANRSPGTLLALHRMLEELARRGRSGITTMRAVLDERPVGAVLPASGLEMRFEQLARESGLWPMRRQVDLGGHEWIGRVDFVHEPSRTIIEVDSVLHHTSPMDRALDADRDAALLAAGFRTVLRVPEEQLWYRPDEVIALLRRTCRA